MPYYVIANFANGRDLRRSPETAPSGSLRVLRNAFINEGGEIEKRKAFVLQHDLTDYANAITRKGRVTGPHAAPIYRDGVPTAFFRHRSDDLPGSPFVTLDADTAQLQVASSELPRTAFFFLVQRSDIDMPSNSSLLHARSVSVFASDNYIIESFLPPPTRVFDLQHVYVEHDSAGIPTDETEVTANEGRLFQITLRTKGYIVRNNTLFASAVGDPTDMAGTGSGSVDLTTQGFPIGEGQSLAEYFGQLVVFGRRGAMFFEVSADFDETQYLRSVETSLFGPRTPTGYSSGDILFLTRGGIRSLQARDSSSEARVSDVGSPIDTEIRNLIRADQDDDEPLFGSVSDPVNNSIFYDLAAGIVHPDSGQFWLSLRDQIHVLSRYPSAKVLAWSTFDLPTPSEKRLDGPNGAIKGQWMGDWCQLGETICLRNFADEVYIYGGNTGDEYDNSEAEIVLPFMDMGRPGTLKKFIGLDVVCHGKWSVEVSAMPVDDQREISWIKVAEIDGGTRSRAKVSLNVSGVQIALRLTCSDPIPARIAEVIIHYNEANQK